ncbi:hypothetical protein R3P38DRAFT_3301604 [Favolaschia claudopus]|uniref:Riboflavin synthase n=1 Tax=Favolaschia claudopus TaxID=2862362 RepID=A0AAW0EHA0_9AGAR
MFTGLIEHLGTVSSVQLDAAGCTMTIAQAAEILGDCHIGDSIAVNGACLTVTEFDAAVNGGWFKVWLANETLERTDLGERKVGDQVNLERAMAAHVRFGGHFVQAHVDTTATVVERTSDGDSLRLTFEIAEPTPERPSLLQYIVPKGYVTIDGASLTVTGVDDAQRRFSVMLIQHTQEKISLGTQKRVGSTVNIEVDMVGKYVEKSVMASLSGGENTHLREMVEKVVESRNYASRSPSPYKNIPAVSPTAFRPKAKVNGSATSNLAPRKATSVVSSASVSRPASVRSVASTSTARTGASLTPRSQSPFKQPSPAPRPRAPITRGLTAKAGGVQETRRASVTGDPRYASSSPIPVSEILDLSGDEHDSPAPSPRITAKLTRRNSNELPPSPPLLPTSTLTGSLRVQPHRARVPSISSNASSSSSPFYSANSGTSPPNPHRYNAARASPPSNAPNYYQPFPRDDNVTAKYPRTNGFAKVDPTSIPLPPHSPPTSTVSFSSRSSRSPSSVSYATDAPRPRSGSHDTKDAGMRRGLENLMQLSEMLPTEEDGKEDDSEEEDHSREGREDEFRASTFERKPSFIADLLSRPKIADLEITNRSLLTINTSLEQTKHRQAKEIRELRRKLRESRLILPPRKFREVKSVEDDVAEDEDDDEEEEEEPEEAEKAEKAREEHDVTYRRIKVILDDLLESGRRALETTPLDFPEPVKITKVLSAYEMHADDENDDEENRKAEGAKAPPSPSHVAVPDSDDPGVSSEDEVEAMTLPRDSPPPSHPPSPHESDRN